jgi:hypothetical protein
MKLQEINIDGLNRDELLQLKEEVKNKLAQYKPLTLGLVWKKCGKKWCTCSGGSLREYGHGPYVVGWYYDGSNKQKVKSFGRWHNSEEIQKKMLKHSENMGNFNWFNFTISEKKYNKLSQEKKWRYQKETLTNSDFFNKYGFERGKKTFIDDKIIIDFEKLDNAREKLDRERELLTNSFIEWGIVTYRGYINIKFMIDSGYYITNDYLDISQYPLEEEEGFGDGDIYADYIE